MAIGPRLDLRQSQQLVMTPQLQLAIKLLTLTNVELEGWIAEELERNPLFAAGDAAEPQEPAGPSGVDAPPDALPVFDPAFDDASSAGLEALLRDGIGGGDVFGAGPALPGKGADVDCGIEEHKGIGHSADARGIAGGIEAFDGGGAGGEVSTCGAAADDQFTGFDAELGGMGTHPANGALGVLHTGVGLGFVDGFDAVIGAGGDDAPAGEIVAEGGELLVAAAGPAAAEEEHRTWALVLGSPISREGEV
jgi:hypothetical protein